MRKIEVSQSNEDTEPLMVRVKRVVGAVALTATPFLFAGELGDEPLRATGVQTVNAESLEEAVSEHTDGVGEDRISTTDASSYVSEQLGDEFMDQANTTGVFTVPENIENVDNDLLPFQQQQDWDMEQEGKK